jgi:hypothetical protein
MVSCLDFGLPLGAPRAVVVKRRPTPLASWATRRLLKTLRLSRPVCRPLLSAFHVSQSLLQFLHKLP